MANAWGPSPNTEYRVGAKGPWWFVVLFSLLAFPLAVVFTVVMVAWRWAKRAVAENERIW